MYFPKLYPDELLYSGIARCRVHLGIGNHKTLLHILFGNNKVTAITDLPTDLITLANNTGLDAESMILNHTLFPLYAPFISAERGTKLFQSMLVPDRPTIGLAGASTALIKWPEWLRYCPTCLKEMVRIFGEPYWRRSWQIKGIDACSEHGCKLLNSPIPYRRPHRHEFHPASLLFLPRDLRVTPLGDEELRLSRYVIQLLELKGIPAPGYGRWSNFYQHLATEFGARRGRQIRAEVIWEKILATHSKDWLVANALMKNEEPPSWLLTIFRKHRKGFSALQHMVVWNSLRPSQSVRDLVEEVSSRQILPITTNLVPLLSVTAEDKEYKRNSWLLALRRCGGAKYARENGWSACYAWLYRYDKKWLLETNRIYVNRKGNNSSVDWSARDRKLVRLLIRIEKNTNEDLYIPRRSRCWFLKQIPHRSSVEHNLIRLPLCNAFFSRYVESIGEYQIRRITLEKIKDVSSGEESELWALKRRCGLSDIRLAKLANNFICQVFV